MKTSAIRLATAAARGRPHTDRLQLRARADRTRPEAAAQAAAARTLSLLIDNDAATVKSAQAVVDAFEKANPGVTVKTETRPGGSDGDNIVKTKLSTGEMQDVFWYNSGSLLQALNPSQTLVDLTNDPAIANVDPSFFPVVYPGRQGLRRAVRAPPSAGGSSTTRTSTPSSACRSPRRGTTSWRTPTRSRPPASRR